MYSHEIKFLHVLVNSNMAAISLYWNSNMATVTSCENALVIIEHLDVSFSCVSLVTDHEFRHNIVKVAVDPRGNSRVDPQNML